MPSSHSLRDRRGVWRNSGMDGRVDFPGAVAKADTDRQTQQAVKCELKQNLSKQGSGQKERLLSGVDQDFFPLE